MSWDQFNLACHWWLQLGLEGQKVAILRDRLSEISQLQKQSEKLHAAFRSHLQHPVQQLSTILLAYHFHRVVDLTTGNQVSCAWTCDSANCCSYRCLLTSLIQRVASCRHSSQLESLWGSFCCLLMEGHSPICVISWKFVFYFLVPFVAWIMLSGVEYFRPHLLSNRRMMELCTLLVARYRSNKHYLANDADSRCSSYQCLSSIYLETHSDCDDLNLFSRVN